MVPQVPDPREQVSYLLWQLAHTMQQEMTTSLAELNLTLSQLGALAHLRPRRIRCPPRALLG